MFKKKIDQALTNGGVLVSTVDSVFRESRLSQAIRTLVSTVDTIDAAVRLLDYSADHHEYSGQVAM